MNFKSSYLLIASLVILLSCSEKKIQGVIDGDDIIPPKPPFWEYFTVLGFDEDNDGVRDDYELYVNENFDDINVRRALKYEAKVKLALLKPQEPNEINRLFLEMYNASTCIRFFIRNPKNSVSKIIDRSGKILNNTWRINQFNKIDKHLSRKFYPDSRFSIMYKIKHCRIEFDNLRDMLKPFLENGDYKRGATPEEIKEFERIMGIK